MHSSNRDNLRSAATGSDCSLPGLRQTNVGQLRPSHSNADPGRSAADPFRVRNPGTTLATQQTRPNAVVRDLHRRTMGPDVTERGRAILKDMDDLAEDYFGGVETSALPPLSGGCSTERLEGAYSRAQVFYTPEATPRSWQTGPVDPAGKLFDASNSNLLCMDVQISASRDSIEPMRGPRRSQKSGPLCVVGSADHGLKVFDIVSMKEKKNLYNKTNGHTEWVTTCKFLTDGRVISGGMDSKLCLWDNVSTGGPARAQDLVGHTGSVSKVDVNDCNRAVSASYDRTLRIWDCSNYGSEMGVLAGHKGPVMQFDWCGSEVLSGDRQGTAKVWDLNTSACVCTMATKRGQIGALGHLLHNDFGLITLFGDQGGVLTCVDLRQGKKPIFQREVHPGGVVSGIRAIPSTPYIVTCGADKRIVVMDPRRNFELLFEFTDHTDFIYSLETFGPLVLSGAGNGWLMVHDTIKGKCCYGLGANEGAVREIIASPSYLVAAGDDGKAAVYTYQ